MADRTVNVRLLADIDGFLQNMEKAKAKTKETASAIEQHAAKNAETYTRIGTGLLTVGTLAAAGFGLALAKFAEFDQKMSHVQAATGESAANMDILRQAALDAGSQTAFSATEAAGAIEELAKAGLSTADIIGGALTGALNLAAASGISVADAAETIATTLNQFNLEGSDSAHVADLLAAAAGNAQGGVEEMSGALSQSALVAAQMGLSVEETTGTLAAFAAAGLMGSDAGTSFRSMLMRMANPTGEAAELMKDLGLAFYDANGEFVGMEAVAGQLEKALLPLPQAQRDAAMATLFGSDAIRAANILYSEGADGIADWTEKVDDAGYAADQAAAMQDNLRGDVEKLMGAIETLMITVGAGADGPLRSLVQMLEGLVNRFNELDPAAQNVIIGIAGVLTAASLLAGGVLIALPKIAAFKTALAGLTGTAVTTKTALLGLGIAGGAGLAISGLAALAMWLESTRPPAEDFTAAIRDGASAVDLLNLANQGLLNNIDGFEFDTTKVGDYLDQIERMDENFFGGLIPENYEVQFTDFSSRIRQIGDALGDMSKDDLPGAIDAFMGLSEELGLNDEQMVQLLDQMPELRDEWARQSDEAGNSVSVLGLVRDAQDGVAISTEEATEQVQEQVDAYSDLLDGIEETRDTILSATDAQFAHAENMRDTQQVIADLTTGVYANQSAVLASKDAWDTNTEAGAAAYDATKNQILGLEDLISTQQANGASQQTLNSIWADGRQELVNSMVQMGWSEQAASAYIDELLRTPSEINTEANIETATAQGQIDRFINNNSGRTITINQRVVEVAGNTTPGGNRWGYSGGYATGGIIPGYPSDQDNIYAALATGEFVVNARQTARHRALLEAINSGTLPGYANGGLAMSPTYNRAPVINFTAPAGIDGTGLNVGSINFVADGTRIQPQVDAVMHAFRTYTRGGRR